MGLPFAGSIAINLQGRPMQGQPGGRRVADGTAAALGARALPLSSRVAGASTAALPAGVSFRSGLWPLGRAPAAVSKTCSCDFGGSVVHMGAYDGGSAWVTAATPKKPRYTNAGCSWPARFGPVVGGQHRNRHRAQFC
eukprot:COSAG06_NODE_10173_length_1735_cov_6.757946_2_plen_138_part_00